MLGMIVDFDTIGAIDLQIDKTRRDDSRRR